MNGAIYCLKSGMWVEEIAGYYDSQSLLFRGLIAKFW